MIHDRVPDEQDAQAALDDPAHVPAKDRAEATFLPGLISDFLRTLKDIMPPADGKRWPQHGIGSIQHTRKHDLGRVMRWEVILYDTPK